jgi:hypothetical protein
MVQLHSVSDQAQVLDTMIGLTRLSLLQRVIVAGSRGMDLHLGLRRRGFLRVARISTSWIPRRQHAIALLADRNATAIEEVLDEISPYLAANATVAILIDSDSGAGPGSSNLRNSGLGNSSHGIGQGVRTKLQQMGFQIEAGVRCHQGFVLSACRQGFGRIERAA